MVFSDIQFQNSMMELAAKQGVGVGGATGMSGAGSRANNNSSGDSFLPREQGRSEQTATFVRVRAVMKSILSNLKYQILISILTIYTLFFDDFRTALFDADKDTYFDDVGLFILGLFTLEIVVTSIFIDGYFLSFFFFLDIISTASIIFDVNFLSDIIFGTENSSSLTQLAAQSKASRAATRAVRIVKLVRIIRIIKLYKNAEKAKEIKEKEKRKGMLKEKILRRHKQNESNAKDPSSFVQHSQSIMINEPKRADSQKIYPQEQIQQNGNNINNPQAGTAEEVLNHENDVQINDEELEAALRKESKIGQILSQMSIKKIIIVILLLMFIIPLFSIDVYRDPENAWDYHLKNQMELLMLPPSAIPTASISKLINTTVESYIYELDFIILYSTPFNELPHFQSVDLAVLRSGDLISSVQTINVSEVLAKRPDLTLATGLSTKNSNSLTVILDQKVMNKINAAFSLAKTLFVCLVLILLLQLFGKDINTLLVQPIEGMMEKLMLMAKDPQSAAKEELNANTELETTVISNAIIKIGALLSIVFGSAGAEIIGSNIIQEGDMNPMIEGKKKCAIFGFCDIRHFTEVTEVLQEEILIFVNKIGSLVHESVYRYGGSANKNIGEAFLLVWKIPEEKYALDYQTNAIEWKDRRYLSVLSDFAVLGFVKTLIKIHKDPLVLQYGMDSRLRASMPDFTVSMGFGLHVGWAIEGAIGSEYKIDASYLSPNVNMASRLEAATKQFGVDFLISEDLYELLTADMKTFFRNIDRVTVKGSEKPIRLYTIDLNYDRITPPARKDIKYADPADMPDSENKRAINMECLRDEEIDQYNAKKFIMGKKELRQVLHHNLPEDFKKRFELGVSCYLKGKWGDSRLHLCEAMKHKLNDGPSKTLLNYMKKSNFVAPSSWKQYRPLTSK